MKNLISTSEWSQPRRRQPASDETARDAIEEPYATTLATTGYKKYFLYLVPYPT